MNQKGFANIILIVVIVILVGVVGYFAFVKKSEPIAQQPTPTQTQTTTPTKTPVSPTPTPKNETANWEAYRNTKYRFESKYPPELLADYGKPWHTNPDGWEFINFISPVEGNLGPVEIGITIRKGADFASVLEENKKQYKLLGTKNISGETGYLFESLADSGGGKAVKTGKHLLAKHGNLFLTISFSNKYVPLIDVFLLNFGFTK